MICDIFKPDCLVRACCSNFCDLIKNVIDDRYNSFDNNSNMYELFEYDCCPICGGLKLYTYDFNPTLANHLNVYCNLCGVVFYINLHSLVVNVINIHEEHPYYMNRLMTFKDLKIKLNALIKS